MKTQKINLIDEILSDENIFEAIYSLESYITEYNLLSTDDLVLFYKLKDKYNKDLIIDTISKCKSLLRKILKKDEYFEIKVFFKYKKWNKNHKCVECRPIHTASLITQICIVCLLNKIMYKKDESGTKVLSDIAQLIPENFYGNIPSIEPERIFFDWRIKYKEYTEKIIDTYNEAIQNHTYKYEISLDLINFFPNINPEIISSFCLKHAEHLYYDKENFKLILKKLLYFKIVNLNSDKSYKIYFDNERETLENTFSYGIPQGLPQSYFFGNLCMIILYKIFDKYFPGKSFFYVDDSTIFTNSENASSTNFSKTIKKLNSEIKKEINLYLNTNDNSKYDIIHKYEINVHNDEKSTVSEIQLEKKLSKVYLHLIAKEASGISYDMKNTMATFEDITLSKKLEKLELAIAKELKNLENYKNSHDENKNIITFCNLYKKSLLRYNKFFNYRKHLLNYRHSSNYDELEKHFETDYFKLNNTPSDNEETLNKLREEISEHIDADNFLAEAQLIFNSLSNNTTEFIDKITKFESILINNVGQENLYFKENFKSINVDVTPYDTLDVISKQKILSFNKNDINLSITYSENNISNFCKILGYGNTYDKSICKSSNEYKRKIFNACLSRIFNIHLTDNPHIYKLDNRVITYYELCLFSFIRNRNANLDDFHFPIHTLKDENIGYDIFEVLHLFIKYVKRPEYIEHLILMHRYISSIWKNGSRFLYFYTLHNQEHSIELIKRTVSLCKVIDYFKLKTEDYYILFLACYLHDVSMAIQPKIDSFTSDTEETDIISFKFYEELTNRLNFNNQSKTFTYNKNNIKSLMKLAFEKVNNYFETVARNNHAFDSATFIKTNKDLSLLNIAIRKEVATVSEAHAYNHIDVYDLKSKAKSECISEKYIMIILRIADLIDGAKNRVSLNILKHNIANMPDESKFHWVTHAITDEININSDYEFNDSNTENKDNFVSVLNKNCLKENIIVTIKVNECNLTAIPSKGCSYAEANLDQDNKSITIEINDNNKCTCEKCIFICKWILTKNNYLLSELYALNQYLNRNSTNLFDTSIKIKIDFLHADKINPDYYSIVNNKINK